MTTGIKECKSGERCVVCLGVVLDGFKPFARTGDGIICTLSCWNAFSIGSRLLARVKNFAPWQITRIR